MDLRELRSFLTIVHTGSVTRAAEELHITQPALSRQIAGLERDLGCTLLDRGRHGAIPTEEGLLLARRAEALVELADKTEHELRMENSEVGGSVTVCCGQIASIDEISNLLASFRELQPRVQVALYVTTAESSLRRLREGRADLAVLLEPFEPAELDFARLRTREYWVTVVRNDDPLAAYAAVRPSDLANGTVILPRRAGAQSVLANWFGEDFSRLDVGGTANLNVAGEALVRAGVGRSIQIAHKSIDGDLVQIPIDPPLATNSALVWLHDRPMSRAAKAFAQFARDRLA